MSTSACRNRKRDSQSQSTNGTIYGRIDVSCSSGKRLRDFACRNDELVELIVGRVLFKCDNVRVSDELNERGRKCH